MSILQEWEKNKLIGARIFEWLNNERIEVTEKVEPCEEDVPMSMVVTLYSTPSFRKMIHGDPKNLEIINGQLKVPIMVNKPEGSDKIDFIYIMNVDGKPRNSPAEIRFLLAQAGVASAVKINKDGTPQITMATFIMAGDSINKNDFFHEMNRLILAREAVLSMFQLG